MIKKFLNAAREVAPVTIVGGVTGALIGSGMGALQGGGVQTVVHSVINGVAGAVSATGTYYAIKKDKNKFAGVVAGSGVGLLTEIGSVALGQMSSNAASSSVLTSMISGVIAGEMLRARNSRMQQKQKMQTKVPTLNL